MGNGRKPGAKAHVCLGMLCKTHLFSYPRPSVLSAVIFFFAPSRHYVHCQRCPLTLHVSHQKT